MGQKIAKVCESSLKSQRAAKWVHINPLTCPPGDGDCILFTKHFVNFEIFQVAQAP